jgi:glycosyltransferase involved in cell wall biosynthesis
LDDTWAIVPVYNEVGVVREVLTALAAQFPHVAAVDDASTDGSAAAARTVPGVIVLEHAVNLGQGAALQTGIAYALRDPAMRRLVTFDADGQHRVEDALSLVTALGTPAGDGRPAEVVLGTRFPAGGAAKAKGDGGPGRARRAVLRLATAYTNASVGLRLTDTHTGLRAMTREVAAALDIRQNRMAHASEILEQIARGGFAHTERPVEIAYSAYSRAKGQPALNAVNIVVDLILRPSR